MSKKTMLIFCIVLVLLVAMAPTIVFAGGQSGPGPAFGGDHEPFPGYGGGAVGGEDPYQDCPTNFYRPGPGDPVGECPF